MPHGNSRRSWPRENVFHQARKVNLDDCPAGYDQDTWGLALHFEQCAAREGIRLAVGRPVLYALLEPRCRELRERYARRTKKWTVDGEHEANWQEVVYEAIRWRLAEYNEDEHVADWFCDQVVFRDIIRAVKKRGYNRRLSYLNREEPDGSR